MQSSTFCLISSLIHYRLRHFRRLAVEGFSKSAVQHFHPIQTREAIMLALAMIKSPPTLAKHFQRHASSIVLSVNYHLPPAESEDDPCVEGIETHARRILHELHPGTRLVEYFPWMRYIPSRQVHFYIDRQCLIVSCRFAKWKRDAQYWFIQDSLMFQRLLGKVADDLVRASCSGQQMRRFICANARRTELIDQASVLQ
jgi:hypothetical protein